MRESRERSRGGEGGRGERGEGRDRNGSGWMSESGRKFGGVVDGGNEMEGEDIEGDMFGWERDARMERDGRERTGRRVRREETDDEDKEEGDEDEEGEGEEEEEERGRSKNFTVSLKTSEWWEKQEQGFPSLSELQMPDLKKRRERVPAEEKWKKKMARKREKNLLAEESTPAFERYLDREEGGEEWKKRKLNWMLEELVVMRPSPLVKLLNAQRSWISPKDVRYIIDRLLDDGEGLRAVRVLKWNQQMDWYEPNFDIYTRLAEEMARMSKISRCMEIYDMMMTRGMAPLATTYEIIINSLLKEGQAGEIEKAWALYQRMKQFAETAPSTDLQSTLFQYLSGGPWNTNFISRAETVLRDMQRSGGEGSEDMYSRLTQLLGRRGEVEKVEELMEEMKNLGLTPNRAALAAILEACAKSAVRKKARQPEFGKVETILKMYRREEGDGDGDGDKEGEAEEREEIKALAERAERGFAEIKKLKKNPDASMYSLTMESFSFAGWHEKVEKLYEEMEERKMVLNVKVHNLLMEAYCEMGKREKAENLLKEMVEGNEPLGVAYNALLKMYVEKGELEKVEEAFKNMEVVRCDQNEESYNLLIESYLQRAKRGQEIGEREEWLKKANDVYKEMKEKGGVGVNQKTFELMLSAFVEGDKKEEAKELYTTMQSTVGTKLKMTKDLKNSLIKVVGLKKILLDEKLKLKLDTNQRELLVGILLGGARIESHDNDRTYEIHFEQNVDNPLKLELLNYLYQSFRDWAQSAPKLRLNEKIYVSDSGSDSGSNSVSVSFENQHRKERRRGDLLVEKEEERTGKREAEKDEKILHFATVSHGSFRFYAHQWQPEAGKGKVPRLIHRWLSPRALAFWYMYGGSRCFVTGGILLNAKNYSVKEVSLVVDAMKARSMDCERRRRRGEGGDVIRFTGKSAEWLWKLMEPFVLESMREELRPREGSRRPSRREKERAERGGGEKGGEKGGRQHDGSFSGRTEEGGGEEEEEEERGGEEKRLLDMGSREESLWRENMGEDREDKRFSRSGEVEEGGERIKVEVGSRGGVEEVWTDSEMEGEEDEEERDERRERMMERREREKVHRQNGKSSNDGRDESDSDSEGEEEWVSLEEALEGEKLKAPKRAPRRVLSR